MKLTTALRAALVILALLLASTVPVIPLVHADCVSAPSGGYCSPQPK